MMQLYINKIAPEYEDAIVTNWIKEKYLISVAWYVTYSFGICEGWIVNYDIQLKKFEILHIIDDTIKVYVQCNPNDPIIKINPKDIFVLIKKVKKEYQQYDLDAHPTIFTLIAATILLKCLIK